MNSDMMKRSKHMKQLLNKKSAIIKDESGVENYFSIKRIMETGK